MNSGSNTRTLKKPERHTQILLELRLAPHVRISDLARTFGVTTETVRRDIADLSARGLLQKSHGGASPRAPGTHRVLNERQRERVDERRQLAGLAVRLVNDGQSLMIDAGATTMEFARAVAISGKTLTVFTNSLQVAMILGTSSAVRIIMTPGDYLNEEAALTGIETCAFLRRYHVDACFLGASALDQSGVSESVVGFAEVKRTMIEQCNSPYFLIDGSKFGKRHLVKVAEMDEIGSLITDTRPAGSLADVLKNHCVETLLPDETAKRL